MTTKYTCFKFKQFNVQQSNAAMKIGTDGILLGAWANVALAKRALDIGTGTGVIALMQTQKNSTVNVDAIEVDSTACIDAEQNFTKSPWKNRLHLFHSALENFNPAYKYDTIISNPPFFENSILSKSKKRTLARHSASLHYSQVLSFAKNQLTPEGNICLILPFSEEEKCIKIATDLGFFMNRICNVFPKKNKKQHRTLIEFSSLPNNLVNETLVIEKEERHNYTEEYRSLTKDFYIIFD